MPNNHKKKKNRGGRPYYGGIMWQMLHAKEVFPRARITKKSRKKREIANFIEPFRMLVLDMEKMEPLLNINKMCQQEIFNATGIPADRFSPIDAMIDPMRKLNATLRAIDNALPPVEMTETKIELKDGSSITVTHAKNVPPGWEE